MTKPLLIIGSSGYAKEIAQIAKRIDPNNQRWDKISYVAAKRTEIGTNLLFGRVDYCDEDILSGSVTGDVAIALGEPHLRQRVVAQYSNVPGLTYPNLIDPSVDYDPDSDHDGDGQCDPSLRRHDVQHGHRRFQLFQQVLGHRP